MKIPICFLDRFLNFGNEFFLKFPSVCTVALSYAAKLAKLQLNDLQRRSKSFSLSLPPPPPPPLIRAAEESCLKFHFCRKPPTGMISNVYCLHRAWVRSSVVVKMEPTQDQDDPKTRVSRSRPDQDFISKIRTQLTPSDSALHVTAVSVSSRVVPDLKQTTTLTFPPTRSGLKCRRCCFHWRAS